MSASAAANQLALALLDEPQERTPGSCPDEQAVTNFGGKPKSYCAPWARWTNCREAGHCTRAGAEDGSGPFQASQNDANPRFD